MSKNQPSEFTCKVMQLVLAQSQVEEKGKELNKISQTLSSFMPSQMFLPSEQAEELKEAARVLQRLVEKAINTNYAQKREYTEKLTSALEQENSDKVELENFVNAHECPKERGDWD